MALITFFFTTLFLLLLSPLSSSAQMPTSTISAAPALLPTLSPSPFSSPSPSLSPDISPLFPSQGPSVNGLSPTESTLPIIPSSPSPPNPDDIAAAQGPTMAFSPFGSNSLPDSSSHSLSPFMLVLFLVPSFWFLHLFGM